MSSISAGLSQGTALVSTGDTTGELVLKTNGGTTAVTIDTSQNVTVAGDLTVNGTLVGGGDVVGPASATDNAVARFDGTTGKLIQNSAVTIADSSGDITTGGVVLTANGSVSNPSFAASGDTNTGLYFPAADTIGLVCGGTEDFRVDGDGQLWNTINSQVGTDYTTLYKGYFCRAWVNFNGTGTVAIRASGNVSSITDNGTGDYTVNFTTAMPDTDYSFSVGCATSANNIGLFCAEAYGNPSYTSSGRNAGDFRVTTKAAARLDTDLVGVNIFR